MFLHQSSTQGHLHILTAKISQLLQSLLAASIVNVQMEDLGESQPKSTQISA